MKKKTNNLDVLKPDFFNGFIDSSCNAIPTWSQERGPISKNYVIGFKPVNGSGDLNPVEGVETMNFSFNIKMFRCILLTELCFAGKKEFGVLGCKGVYMSIMP